MPVTKQEVFEYEFRRETDKGKKFKNPKKLNNRIREAMNKLNNKNCYEFFDDPKSRSFHNLLEFLNLLEIKCEKLYGEKDKYKKGEVEKALQDVFYNATDKECDVIKNINRLLKITDEDQLLEFKFKGLLKHKEFLPCDRFPEYEGDE